MLTVSLRDFLAHFALGFIFFWGRGYADEAVGRARVQRALLGLVPTRVQRRWRLSVGGVLNRPPGRGLPILSTKAHDARCLYCCSDDPFVLRRVTID